MDQSLVPFLGYIGRLYVAGGIPAVLSVIGAGLASTARDNTQLFVAVAMIAVGAFLSLVTTYAALTRWKVERQIQAEHERSIVSAVAQVVGTAASDVFEKKIDVLLKALSALRSSQETDDHE
jgi:uncharacterized protein (DUF58 family)